MEFIDLKEQKDRIRGGVLEALIEVIDSGQYILGEKVGKLEAALCKFTKAEYCISCANGTDALQIALMALGVAEGDEVITPSFSYIASAETIKLLGAKPVYIDIDPNTFLLDIQHLEGLITPKTKVIMPVSLFGLCPDFDQINDIAKKHNLMVIEDAAQSFGAVYKNSRSCNLSDIACTSFFPTKPLGCYGDGGAIFTNDKKLAESIRKIARHGQVKKYEHEVVGVNSRLDTIQAAIVLEKLNIFEDELIKRAKIAETYSSLLADVPFIEVPRTFIGKQSAWAQYSILCDHRKELVAWLEQHQIPTNIYYQTPLHEQIATEDKNASLPNTDLVSDRVLSLPMHPYLCLDEVKYISQIIGNFKKIHD